MKAIARCFAKPTIEQRGIDKFSRVDESARTIYMENKIKIRFRLVIIKEDKLHPEHGGKNGPKRNG